MKISRVQYAFINDQGEIIEAIELINLKERPDITLTGPIFNDADVHEIDLHDMHNIHVTNDFTMAFARIFSLNITFNNENNNIDINENLKLQNHEKKTILTFYSTGYTLDQARQYIELTNLSISFKFDQSRINYIEIGKEQISQGANLNLQTKSIDLITAIMEYDLKRVKNLKQQGGKLDIDSYKIYSKLQTILETPGIKKLFEDVITEQIIEEFENQQFRNFKTLVQSRNILLKLKPLKGIIQQMEKIIMQQIEGSLQEAQLPIYNTNGTISGDQVGKIQKIESIKQPTFGKRYKLEGYDNAEKEITLRQGNPLKHLQPSKEVVTEGISKILLDYLSTEDIVNVFEANPKGIEVERYNKSAEEFMIFAGIEVSESNDTNKTALIGFEQEQI